MLRKVELVGFSAEQPALSRDHVKLEAGGFGRSPSVSPSYHRNLDIFLTTGDDSAFCYDSEFGT